MNHSHKVCLAVSLTFLSFLSLVLAVPPAMGEGAVLIPGDTIVYAELPRDVTSKKKETNAGDIVRARVFRDVNVDGAVVIAEGSELLLRVSHVKKARILGRKGRLGLEAVAVRAVDGTMLPLTGYYYQAGKGRKVVTGTLAVVVAWPFAFLKGKNAKVNEGTVFEARTVADARVETWKPARAL